MILLMVIVWVANKVIYFKKDLAYFQQWDLIITVKIIQVCIVLNVQLDFTWRIIYVELSTYVALISISILISVFSVVLVFLRLIFVVDWWIYYITFKVNSFLIIKSTILLLLWWLLIFSYWSRQFICKLQKYKSNKYI